MAEPEWMQTNRPVSDDDAAESMGNDHPKSKRSTVHDSFKTTPGGFPGSAGGPGAGSAPGANGPPTTGAIGPGGPLSST